MIEEKIVREFNWFNEDLLKENPKVLEMSLYLNDTKEVDDVRRLLGQASQPPVGYMGVSYKYAFKLATLAN